MPPGGTPRRPRKPQKRQRFGSQRTQVVRVTTWIMVVAMFLTIVVYLLAR
ncbi:MAG TPA: hypothetical protein VHA57_02225 [Actinomycetota bacterium]|nr:hypothetical protein [Actinomycetota bacterium]